jgi:hypothetical protein
VTIKQSQLAGTGITVSGTSANTIFSATYLDDVSNLCDGFTNAFPLTYNQQPVSVLSPTSLIVTVNGAIQPSFNYNYDVIWGSQVLDAKDGYTIDQNGLLKFCICPPQGSSIQIKTEYNSSNAAIKVYPFAATDIVMGIN